MIKNLMEEMGIKNYERIGNTVKVYKIYKEYYNGELRAIGKKYNTVLLFDENELFVDLFYIDEIVIEKEFFEVD